METIETRRLEYKSNGPAGRSSSQHPRHETKERPAEPPRFAHSVDLNGGQVKHHPDYHLSVHQSWGAGPVVPSITLTP